MHKHSVSTLLVKTVQVLGPWIANESNQIRQKEQTNKAKTKITTKKNFTLNIL